MRLFKDPRPSWKDSDRCPCGSGASREECCSPLLAGTELAASPEALMRSRYSAHVLGDVEYVVQTTLPEQQAGLDREAIRAWAIDSTWIELEVLAVEGGGQSDEGFVEFRASFESGCVLRSHEERSRFERRDGRWYFDARPQDRPAATAHGAPHPGRNAPCSCGSGKKFKKCCGS